MWKQLSDVELNIKLYDFLEKIKKIDKRLHIVYSMLYKHGLRVNEVLELDRWTLDNNNQFNIVTEKSSEIRKINMAEVSSEYLVLLSNKMSSNRICSYDVAKDRFKKYFDTSLYYSDKKRICTHIFRHNYVKRLIRKGLTEREVAILMGHKNEKNTLNYINSKIYFIPAIQLAFKLFG